MRVAILNDTHFGARNDSAGIISHQSKFYRDIFFPYLKQNNIGTVIHLGDLFDRRKYINFQTLDAFKTIFFNKLRDNNITTHLLLGNHDVAYKNTNDVNSPELLLQEYKNIMVYRNAKDVEIGNLNILFVPWITIDNFKSSFELVSKTKAQIIMGHLEIAGFEMYKGSIIGSGFDRNMFSRFETVATGHFHHRSRQDNIYYLGAPYEMMWSDYNDTRGFHIFDTETREFTHINNPIKLFHKIVYDDSQEMNIDFKAYAGTYVKLIIKNKNNPYKFDIFIDKLEKADVLDLQTIEDSINMDFDNEDLVNEAESTLDILNAYVDRLELKQKDILKKTLFDLYHEAMSL